MIKVIEISQTQNAEFSIVKFEEVRDEFALATGMGKAKVAFQLVSTADHKFTVGAKYNKRIETTPHDEPQYVDHKPFEKTGKYYTSKIV